MAISETDSCRRSSWQWRAFPAKLFAERDAGQKIKTHASDARARLKRVEVTVHERKPPRAGRIESVLRDTTRNPPGRRKPKRLSPSCGRFTAKKERAYSRRSD